LRAERCYWSGQQSNVSGNVDTSPTVSSQPNPVGWGQSDTYDPTYRVLTQSEIAADVLLREVDTDLTEPIAMAQPSVILTTPKDWTPELKTAMHEGLTNREWSQASELLTALHRELQAAGAPSVDFVLINDYANNIEAISSIRKMLALVLMEKDLVDDNESVALSKLDSFGRSIPEHASEFLINAGLIHLYRQNDLGAAQGVFAKMQILERNTDTAAEENVDLFRKILQDYQRQALSLDGPAQSQNFPLTKSQTASASVEMIQSYPNPFNPETLIRYRISGEAAQEDSLVIFNTLGQQVRKLVAARQNPGESSVVWNGRDNFGKEAASGMYFLRASISGNASTSKLMLVR
jgi:hypothetical protein